MESSTFATNPPHTAVRFSIVVPVFRGATTLETLHGRLVAVMKELGESFEIVLVDDASGDDSWTVIGALADCDRRVRGLQLMRNSGQANATMAGLAEAQGELLITLDDDLQHPPEEIPKLLAALAQDPDLDMIIGAPLEKKHAWWRNLASDLLNWLSRRMFGNESSFKLTTFRLLRRRAVEPLLAMNLPDAAPGALLQQITCRTASVTVDHASRDEGRSGYTLAKMVNLAVHKFLGFSTFPLRALAAAGIAGVGLSLIVGVFYLTRFFSGKIGVPGFTTLILLLIFISGLNFLTLGIFGEYLQQILLTVRRTPPFVVSARASWRESDAGPPAGRPAKAQGRRHAPREALPPVELAASGLSHLSERFGDGFYLCDAGTFRRNYGRLLAALESTYPRSHLACAYQTSRLPLLCRRVDEWGGYTEVSSTCEYRLALRLGVDPARIMFNAPDKRRSDLARALLAGSTANLDAARELPLVAEAAASNPGRVLNVGLRVAADESTRFGFDGASKELRDVAARLRAIPGVRLAGLHCRAMPAVRTAEAYAEVVRRILNLATEFFPDLSGRFVDLGGDTSTGGGFSKIAAGAFAEAFPDGGGPELILEPGPVLGAGVMRLVASVLDVKTLGSRKLALVAGSVHDLSPAGCRRDQSVWRVSTVPAGKPAETGPLDLVGNTGMEDDVLCRDYDGELAAGDFVVFDGVGGHSLMLRSSYSEPTPVLVIDGDDLRQAKLAETFDDVVLPELERGEESSIS